MAFDLKTFEAEIALGMIPTEKLPGVAQDAMEAGFDGPATVDVAIIKPGDGWLIARALPKMLSEIGGSTISTGEAALRLAKSRAERILQSDEDPLPSQSYFFQLMLKADYHRDLIELAYIDDEFPIGDVEDFVDERRSLMLRALENLLSPELREERYARRREAALRAQEESKKDWPYVFDSPGRKKILWKRYKEQLKYQRPIFLAIPVVAALSIWAGVPWKELFLGLVFCVLAMMALPYWAIYRSMKRERRGILLRQRYPEELI